MLIGSLCAAANGAALPAMIIVFGDMIDMFVGTGKIANFLALESVQQFLASVNLTIADILEDVTKLRFVDLDGVW